MSPSVRSEAGAAWNRLAHAALEQDALDAVDLLLIRSLSRRAGREDDLAFKAVTACLSAAVKTGALRIPLSAAAMAPCLERFLRGLHAPESTGPDDPAVLAGNLAAAFEARRLEGAYASVLGSPPDFLPMLQSGGGLYFQKYQAAEALVAERLGRFLAEPIGPSDPAQVDALDTVLRKLPLRLSPGGAPMDFQPGQKAALALALRSRLVVVSGGPGTGKTSLAANLLRAWARARAKGISPERVRLAAPTGRAAQRMAESLRRGLEAVDHSGAAASEAALDKSLSDTPCETLHRLLRYNPGTGEYRHNRRRPLPADLIVVDEVSMVDVFTLARLLDAVPDNATLVLLGDMDQLPSVEAGAVLADLVAGGPSPLRERLVLLEGSHRSDEGILKVTRRVNAQDAAGALVAMGPALPAGTLSTTGGSASSGSSSPAAWPALLLREGRKTCPGGGCRMLAPGPSGVGPADFRARLESWVGFQYQGNAQGNVQGTGPSYADLVRGLASVPMSFDAGAAARAFELKPAGAEPQAFPPGLLAGLDGIFARLDAARILTFTRKGWHGCEAVNRRARDLLVGDWDPRRAAAAPSSSPGMQGFHGAPIMVLENDYAQGLYNGEVGVLLRLPDAPGSAGRHTAFFRKPGSYRAFPEPFLPRHELAFATTVHKAQGSEYDQVMLVLPEAGNRLLFKETLYTALTRARYFAGIYGTEEVLREAVDRKVVRESGLRGFFEVASVKGDRD
jgi:exodeoxyribonuclease V alpha subunit